MADRVKLSGTARSLVVNKLLSKETAELALQEAANQRVPFVTYLVKERTLPALDIAICLAKDFNLPLLELEAFEPDLFPKKILNEELASEYHMLPLLQQGKKLYVAVSDPTNQEALNQLRFQTGCNVVPILVEEDKLSLQIEGGMPVESQKLAEIAGLDNNDLDAFDLSNASDEATAGSRLQADEDEDDAPIIRFVNKIILDGINDDASDIHFEPYENDYRIRYRVDGILREAARPPANLSNRLASRLKVMANLDIAEKRLPQDGRFKMKLSRKRSIGFRVSTCPTLFGEKVTLRILDPTIAGVGIDKLGFLDEQRDTFEEAIQRSQGMILVTGPTGSGKTVTLYTALHILNKPEYNISTVEDPVEIYLNGVNQVNVNNKTGLDFSVALRSFLRQDPDIIMVGEIRDTETAEIAIKAAQTGHLVLSTLHTNSAPETLTRLVSMGVPAFNIATSITLTIAQRLVRVLCNKCKVVQELEKNVLLEEGFTENELESLTIYKAAGCKNCQDGYKGRIGIYEVLPINEDIGRIIMSGGSSLDIAEYARKNGIINLRQSGLLKVRAGITTLEEINRATVE